ncbi:MAG: phosphatase PAP2 family protein [Candidatus Eiseniibacteriota bacterium]
MIPGSESAPAERRPSPRSQRRWKIGILLFVLVYTMAINQLLHVRPDHLFLALVVLAFGFLGKESGRRFLVDWFPFILFWILYDMMRGVADSIQGGYVHVAEPYRWESALFGWVTPGEVPPLWFAGWRAAHDGEWYKGALDLLSANMYTLHFGAPLIFMWILWHTADDRRTFYRFVYTLTVLNLTGLTTFMLYPAAPPWYVELHGMRQPSEVGLVSGAAGGLVALDQMFRVRFFETLWDHFSPNLFAAMPSLHGAYPLTIAVFAVLRFGRRARWVVAYPALTWFAAVYLNQHYIVDLVAGAGYVAVAWLVTERALMPYLFDRWVDFRPRRAPVVEPGIAFERK